MIHVYCTIESFDAFPNEFNVFIDVADQSIFVKSFDTREKAEEFLNSIVLVKIKNRKDDGWKRSNSENPK